MKRHNLPMAQTAKLRELAQEYATQGYEVFTEANADFITRNIPGFRPDLVARKGDTVVVVEVTASRDVEDERLEELASRIAKIPNWRLELVWLGETKPEALPRDQVQRIFAEASQLRDLGHYGPALVIGWAAAEALLNSMTGDDPDLLLARSPKSKLATAESLGLISKRQFDVLAESVEIRNRVAHGVSIDVSAGAVDSLLDTVRLLSREGYASVDQMIDWFRDHYGDPAESTPYDSAEGGYQHVTGGPFDALTVLEEQFPDSDPTDREEAASLLENESTEWAEKG